MNLSSLIIYRLCLAVWGLPREVFSRLHKAYPVHKNATFHKIASILRNHLCRPRFSFKKLIVESSKYIEILSCIKNLTHSFSFYQINVPFSR